ncbi:hypothetical protein BIW11_03143 [Tropilaelaps mercedesae]|uniref:Uncharacterized protein n=1 Tax=Tropilaelaps mercedesae TaxID=418985 RepID=A0A1V9XRN9_9ACAR|nr:hypothetical protein BIW11_03143 [Tropilaelaps mercedesae]
MSVRQLRGGAKLLELFAVEPTHLPSENWNQLRDVLRSYFPSLDSSLNIGKCCHGDVFELSVVSALSVGALIAQDFSKSSASPGQELSGRLKTLCDYRGPEVDAIKDFCEVVCTGERVAAKVREIIGIWMESGTTLGTASSAGTMVTGSNSDLLSVSTCSSASSSSSCAHPMRPPQSPLYALRTPENQQRIRDKYSQEVKAL